MRIIGGFASSLAMSAPKAGTRPTSDRVREALFSALEARDLIRDARVLDLYAGSGALALEAISRGARCADLVERNAGAAGVARRNAERVLAARPKGAEADIRVSVRSVDAFLASAGAPGSASAPAVWDLVFLDPPYELGGEELAATLALLMPLLAEDATVIVERSTRTPRLSLPEGLEPLSFRAYGETAIEWLGRVSR